jgi:hypothetical protein
MIRRQYDQAGGSLMNCPQTVCMKGGGTSFDGLSRGGTGKMEDEVRRVSRFGKTR